jgi:hypothetical protein
MTDSAGGAPLRIFISYRREDTGWAAGWLFDRLASHFGRDQIFKDVDSIELGDDFVEVITTAVGASHALLALIGDRWLTVTGQDGRRRLDNSGDFVRLEIEAALARGVRVIPILVDGARMPPADQLPRTLAPLARRQALELSQNRFGSDFQRLLPVLDRTIAAARLDRQRAELDRQRAEEAAARQRAEEAAARQRQAAEKARRRQAAEEARRRQAEEAKQRRRDRDAARQRTERPEPGARKADPPLAWIWVAAAVATAVVAVIGLAFLH